MPQGEAGQRQAETPKPWLGRRKKHEQPRHRAGSGAAVWRPAGRRPAIHDGLTTELAGFSSSAVADSVFEAPAGFKQVESDRV